MRHSLRSSGRPPHSCHAALVTHFGRAGLSRTAITQRASKRLFWHIDYLLEPLLADLQDILYIRSEARLEFHMAELLENRIDTFAPAPGLGASDHSGHAHFLALQGDAAGWQRCSQDLIASLDAFSSNQQRIRSSRGQSGLTAE